ncbi:hypothetical protein CE489_01720 [Bacillus spizizenii]|nr:hypothetical protein CE489_01720 [Bacillus spizizenii]
MKGYIIAGLVLLGIAVAAILMSLLCILKIIKIVKKNIQNIDQFTIFVYPFRIEMKKITNRRT